MPAPTVITAALPPLLLWPSTPSHPLMELGAVLKVRAAQPLALLATRATSVEPPTTLQESVSGVPPMGRVKVKEGPPVEGETEGVGKVVGVGEGVAEGLVPLPVGVGEAVAPPCTVSA